MEEKDYSQAGEQAVIFTYVDTFMSGKEGRFLDLGSFDGETFSNTRGLFLYRNWNGVFVEAEGHSYVQTYDRYLQEPNRATLVNATICMEEDLNNGKNLISFANLPRSAISTVETVDSISWWGQDQFNERGEKYLPRATFTAKVGMKEILETFAPFDMIKIDVEGISAALALQDWFDPRNYGCKLLLVEPDHPDKRGVALTEKFTSLGYTLLVHTGDNLIFGINPS